MFRIRFHGRGGQGMKTASRIVGTAAFRQGYYAQDSPVYGAERRGAPMMAFTRLDSAPILERGMISSPDLIVIADSSLIDDPLVQPLRGLSADGSVLINGNRSGGPLATVSFDFTALALKHVGSTSALSVALGAGAAKLARLDLRFVEQAVREELAALQLDSPYLEGNLALARACFSATTPSLLAPASPQHPGRISKHDEIHVITPAYAGSWAGTPSVASLPNIALRKTGDWRLMRPVIDQERCTHCWICFVNCPDGAITLRSDDRPEIDYGVCKGCLICAEECPIDAIATPREVEA